MFLLLLVPSVISALDEIAFLKDYGYISTESNAQVRSETFAEALRQFQKMYGLEQTAELDPYTRAAMREPRCSLPDVEKQGIRKRKKRYATRWEKFRLGYEIRAWTRHLAPGTVEAIIARATGEWEKVSDFRFERSPSPDVKIFFGRGYHNCSYPFHDSTLAHAFPPPDGNLHFNDDYKFSEREISTYQEISLMSVATHELGHVLGLAHNPDPDSVMNPRELHRKRGITDRDIWSLKSMYHSSKNHEKHEPVVPRVVSTTEKPKVTERPNPCNCTPDAVGTLRGEYIVFKHDWIWRVSREGSILQQPVKISTLIPQVNSTVDAAVSIKDNLWVFSGKKIYVLTIGGPFLQLKHAPLQLTDLGLPHNMDNVRLAYSWHYFSPSAVYIWGERQYWRLNTDENKVDSSYPRPIQRNWKHVPQNARAAFSKDRELHFIAEDQVYRMNTSDFRLPVEKGYPISVGQLWHGCNLIQRASRLERSGSKLFAITFSTTSLLLFSFL